MLEHLDIGYHNVSYINKYSNGIQGASVQEVCKHKVQDVIAQWPSQS